MKHIANYKKIEIFNLSVAKLQMKIIIFDLQSPIIISWKR